MTRFSADTQGDAVVSASRADIWAALTDPALVAEMTPFVRSITADGDHWRWEMSGLDVLGVKVAPAFTERMRFTEPDRIDFHHDPPAGASEKAGVEGWYHLTPTDDPDATGLATELEITLELPLPRAAGRAVTATMRRVIDTMGDRFSANLLEYLGAEERRA